jgi:hypothetical protein
VNKLSHIIAGVNHNLLDCIMYSGKAPDFPGLAVVTLQMQYQDFGKLYKPDTSLSLKNTKYINRVPTTVLRIRVADPHSLNFLKVWWHYATLFEIYYFLTFIPTIQSHSVHPSPFAEVRLHFIADPNPGVEKFILDSIMIPRFRIQHSAKEM